MSGNARASACRISDQGGSRPIARIAHQMKEPTAVGTAFAVGPPLNVGGHRRAIAPLREERGAMTLFGAAPIRPPARLASAIPRPASPGSSLKARPRPANA